VTFLISVLLLPCLFWDKGPETINQLRQARITRIAVPPSLAESWKNVSDIAIDTADPSRLEKVEAPGVVLRPEISSATHAPWVNSNGWRFLRNAAGHFLCQAPGSAAALATAEAFMFGASAAIHTDDAGLEPFGQMLSFLGRLRNDDFSPLVDIGFIDDGTPASGEFMNLLIRRNLLFKVVKRPDPKLDLTVALGSHDYPRSEAQNPSLLAEKVRSNLTDQKRLLRIYGSEVVIGRLVSDRRCARLFLINYGVARSPVHGLRVRVLGKYANPTAMQFDSADTSLQDVSNDPSGIEFTLPELKTFAVIHLCH